VWDLGGQREFLSMLPLVCNEAAAIFFMFDLSNKDSLTSVKDWYRQARGLNRQAAAFLVGTKYDEFLRMPKEKQAAMDRQARKYAKAMKASVVFTSSTHSVNVQNLFKVVLAMVFDLRCTLTQIDAVGEPLLIFRGSGST
jgi:GTP-binding protein of the ras superfamily involved in termination of M-phase